MNKPNNRKLRFEGLEDRRLAAGFTLQYTNLLNLQQQTSSTSTSSHSTMTYSTFKSSSALSPGISLNHNETLICFPRSAMAE